MLMRTIFFLSMPLLYHILCKKEKIFQSAYRSKNKLKKELFQFIVTYEASNIFSRECAYGASHKLTLFSKKINFGRSLKIIVM